MFRKMRRHKKELSKDQALELLEAGEYGTLATQGEDGYPYALPLNYACHDGAIYFHCAATGHKLDNIANNPRVSFCVVPQAEILPKEFSTRFKSVVVFGQALKVEGEEKEAGLLALIKRFSPDYMEAGKKYIQSAAAKTTVIKIQIEAITAKCGD